MVLPFVDKVNLTQMRSNGTIWKIPNRRLRTVGHRCTRWRCTLLAVELSWVEVCWCPSSWQAQRNAAKPCCLSFPALHPHRFLPTFLSFSLSRHFFSSKFYSYLRHQLITTKLFPSSFDPSFFISFGIYHFVLLYLLLWIKGN